MAPIVYVENYMIILRTLHVFVRLYYFLNHIHFRVHCWLPFSEKCQNYVEKVKKIHKFHFFFVNKDRISIPLFHEATITGDTINSFSSSICIGSNAAM